MVADETLRRTGKYMETKMFVNELFPVLGADISSTAKIVFFAYAGHANSNGMAWPKTSRICELTGFHSSTVRHARTELVHAGMIERVGDGVFRVVPPAPAPVVAKNAMTAAPVPAPEPEPAPEQPTGDNPSPVAAPQPVVVAPAPVATPASTPEPVAKPQPEPQPAPAQPRAQQSAPAPVVAPVAAQEQKPAPMPALEPLPPTPRRNIVSARVARLPDVDEAVRREVDARPVVKSSGEKEVDPELLERAKRLQKLCAENTARSREQKAAAQRFEDGVTAATEQVAKQRAAQDIAAARQRAAQDAAAAKPEQQAAQDAAPPAPVAPVTGQKPEQAATEKTTDGQNADAARDSAARDGCYPADGKTTAPEPVPAETVAQPTPDAPAAPEPVATAPVVVPAPVVVQKSPESAPQPALPIICAPQPPAATPQQGELLPAPAKQSRSVKTVAVQGELLPEEGSTRGRCLPKTWQLPREWGMWAMTELGFTEDEVRYQAKKFRDHWISTTKNPAKKDWFATWRNWMRGENEKKQRYNNRPQQKSKMMQAIEYFANKYNGDFDIPF